MPNVTYQHFDDFWTRSQLVEAVDGLLAEVSAHDGVDALSEAFVRGLHEDAGYRVVVATDDAGDSGSVVAVLALSSANAVELAVLPSRRQQGLGRELLTRSTELLDISGPVDVWAHGDGAAAEKLVDVVGGRRTRELLKMELACAPGGCRHDDVLRLSREAEATIAEQSVEVLTYTEAEQRWDADCVDQEWIRVNNEAFAWHPEQGGWDVQRLDRARDVGWFDPAGVVMLWAEDEVSGQWRCLGFHWTKIPVAERATEFGERRGEVYVVCLADEARGRGLGGSITLLGLKHLLNEGVGVIELYVEGDNAPAVATYRGLGFEVVYRDVVYRGEVAKPESAQ